MKRLIPFVFMICLTVNGIAQCADPSNIYRFEADNKTYDVVMEYKNWIDAAACSKELGGYMADIQTPEEQLAIFDGITSGAGVSDTYVEVLDGGGIAYIWIGGTDKDDEGKWLWDGDDDQIGINFWKGEGANGDNDGVPVEEAYANWGGTKEGTINEPDNFGAGGQDYAAIGLSGWPKGSSLLGSTGEWNDIQGSNELYFVVEYDTTGGPTGIIPGEQIPRCRIYPNPARGLLHVAAKDLKQIEIYDLTGRLMGSFRQSPLDIGDYRKGPYLLKVKMTGGFHQEMFVVE